MKRDASLALTRAEQPLQAVSDPRPKRPSRLGLPDLHGRHGLVAAILIDNVGTGLFLPFAVIYATLVAHISLSVTGLLLSLATVVALPVAPIVGIFADRFGAQRFVVAGNVLQGVGFAGYPLITHPWHLFLCALSVAIGNQMYWATNGAFLAQVAQAAERDRWFALQGACRSAGLGGGAALAGGAVAVLGVSGYSWLAVLNAVSFVAAAGLIARVRIIGLARFGGDDAGDAVEARKRDAEAVQAGPARRQVQLQRANANGVLASESAAAEADAEGRGYWQVLRDGPFLGFTATNVAFSLIVLSTSLTLPVYVVGVLHQPTWVVGALFGMNTSLVALAQTVVVGWIERYRRTRALAFAAGLFGCYFLMLAGLAGLSPGVAAPVSRHWIFAGLVVAMGVYTLAVLVMAPLKNALVADAAPDALRGRYVAFYHLSWSVASATAPALLTGLLAAGPLWLWLTLVAVSCAAVLALWLLDTRLPERATQARRAAR